MVAIPRMEGTPARVAAVGAYVVCLILLALFVFLIWLTHTVVTGGMNEGIDWTLWISVGVIVCIMIAAHLPLAAQLMRAARRR